MESTKKLVIECPHCKQPVPISLDPPQPTLTRTKPKPEEPSFIDLTEDSQWSIMSIFNN